MSKESTTAPLNLDEITCVEISDPAVMNKHPLVSVHMLACNHEQYVAQAIEGVLMQETDFPIELVIGEDCSTDRTREIVLEYQRKHPDVIRVVLWDRNVGLARNWRKVSDLLRGRYIAWCESDDYWTHPKMLRMLLDVMEANPDVGVVHGGVDMCDVARKMLRRWKPRPDDDDDGDIMLKRMRGKHFVCLLAALARSDLCRTVIQRNPDEFDGRFLGLDGPLVYELSRITRFKLINESLATANRLPGSTSKPGGVRKSIRWAQMILGMELHFIRKYNVDSTTEVCVRRRFARKLLEIAYTGGDRRLADGAWRELKNTHAGIGLQELVFYCGARRASVRRAVEVMREVKSVLCRRRM
ncbi:MAG: glycosyltransferase [candidate division WOR-3 bacterium]|nr:glycosyltransferase [candidate division WOR-3 bacterium]